MDDWMTRKAEDRAAVRDKTSTRRARVERVAALLVGIHPGGARTSTAEAAERELPIAAAAVDDKALSEYVGRMTASISGGTQWNAAYGDARHRAGEILNQLE